MLSRFPRFSDCELRWQLSFIFDALVPCEVPVASSCMIGATAVNTLHADTKHTWLVNPKFLALQVVGLWYRSLTVADLTHSFLCVSLLPTRSWCMWVAVASKCDKVCMLQASQPSIWFSFDRFFIVFYLFVLEFMFSSKSDSCSTRQLNVSSWGEAPSADVVVSETGCGEYRRKPNVQSVDPVVIGGPRPKMTLLVRLCCT